MRRTGKTEEDQRIVVHEANIDTRKLLQAHLNWLILISIDRDSSLQSQL